MPRVIIDVNACKGCGLCVNACPKKVLVIHKEQINTKGYSPAHAEHPDQCTGCANCALMCPDVCITVER